MICFSHASQTVQEANTMLDGRQYNKTKRTTENNTFHLTHEKISNFWPRNLKIHMQHSSMQNEQDAIQLNNKRINDKY